MNKYELATLVALNGLDDMEYRKLTAKQQKEMFGYTAIGRKDICFDSRNQGMIWVGKWTDGTNYSTRTYTYAEFAECLNNRQIVEVE